MTASMVSAVAGAFWALDLAGFESAKQTGEPGFFPLAAIYAWVPAVFKAFGALLAWRYPLSEHRHDLIRRSLERRASGS